MTNLEEFSLDGAREAAKRDELGAWVSRFLGSPGSDNPVLGDELAQRRLWWFGPVQVPLDDLHRLAGPPDAPVLCPVDDEFWGDNVDDMERRVEAGWEPPPVIVTHQEDQLMVEDGNHRIESLRRSGARDAWAVIGFDNPEALQEFLTVNRRSE